MMDRGDPAIMIFGPLGESHLGPISSRGSFPEQLLLVIGIFGELVWKFELVIY